jgi:hypothetical protein
MYVLDCRNAFRAFVSVLIGVAVFEVKKVAAGREWWNARIGVDLNADFETAPRVTVSLKGCRIVNAILNDCGESQSALRGSKVVVLMAKEEWSEAAASWRRAWSVTWQYCLITHRP